MRKLAAVLITVLVGCTAVLALVPESGATGTLTCPNFTDTDIPTPPPGQTGYLFIGTSVSTNTSTISGHYTLNGQTVAFGPITGTLQGQGAFHYIVNLPQGAVVTDAAVTGATANTVVTVSGCLNGATVTTTTPTQPTQPTQPTTPTQPLVPTPTVPGSSAGTTRAPTPVVASGRFTG